MYFEYPGTCLRVIGSMHLFPINRPDIPDWVVQAYDWADILVFESNDSFGPILRAPTPVNLQEALSPKAWNSLCQIWPNPGHVPSLVEIQPWAALLMAPSFVMRTSDGVEPNLKRMADRDGKGVMHLEKSADIGAAFESVPIQEVLMGLEMFTRDLSMPQRVLEQMHIAWVQRDLAALYSAAQQSPTFHLSAFRDAALFVRNRRWAPLVHDHMKSRIKTLVVIGSLHLCGPGNVIECVGKGVTKL